MVLGSRKKGLEQIQLKVFSEGEHLEQVSVIKLLGIHLDNRLLWSPHISHLSKKITSTACMIRRIAGYLPMEVLQQSTQALIGSQVSYCYW